MHGLLSQLRRQYRLLPNVWIGTSIESRRVVHRADDLRVTPAAVCGECFRDEGTEHRAQTGCPGGRIRGPDLPGAVKVYARGVEDGRRLDREGAPATIGPADGIAAVGTRS